MSATHAPTCPVCKRSIDDHAPDSRLRAVTSARNIVEPESAGPRPVPDNGKPRLKRSTFEKCLTAIELQGKRARLTIDRIEVEETHPRPSVTERTPVLYFREIKRGLVLSSTNRRTRPARIWETRPGLGARPPLLPSAVLVRSLAQQSGNLHS